MAKFKNADDSNQRMRGGTAKSDPDLSIFFVQQLVVGTGRRVFGGWRVSARVAGRRARLWQAIGRGKASGRVTGPTWHPLVADRDVRSDPVENPGPTWYPFLPQEDARSDPALRHFLLGHGSGFASSRGR